MTNNTEITNRMCADTPNNLNENEAVWFTLSQELPNISDRQSEDFTDYAEALKAYTTAVKESEDSHGMIITLVKCVGNRDSRYTSTVVRM